MDKNLDREAREDLLNQLRLKYHTSSKKEKAEMINAVLLSSGYNRKSAIRALNKPARNRPSKPKDRHKTSRYDSVLYTLRQIWKLSNYLCGKRMHEILPLYISRMSQTNELHLTSEQTDLLLTISAATIDRLLRIDRSKVRPKGPLHNSARVCSAASNSGQDLQSMGRYQTWLFCHGLGCLLR